MGRYDFGCIMAFFPALGMKITFALLYFLDMCPKARYSSLFSINEIPAKELEKYCLIQVTCKTGMN